MKKSPLLAITSIVIIPIAFSIAVFIGQPEIYGLGGMLRYVWVMWLFVPIGIASIVVGIKRKAKANIALGIVSIAFLLLFGSYGFIFQNVNSVTYDDEALQPIESVLEFTFPKNVKAATTFWNDYSLCQGMISSAEKAEFETQLRNSEEWTTQLDPTIKKLMPIMVVPKLESSVQISYDLFLFHNLRTGEYNVVPEKYKNTPCVFIAYDCETGRFLIVTDCTIHYS